ncbi:E3 SUMO-protein ligase PIAS2 isoform X3 [Spodoptera frugiperda]|uniref:E3 SUMO-protein ligase PIAS2 isoform X3 n=1 Tax=Spodoptera frugiperda TaxID=7108 RepID=A0A9R0CZV6_SPOFR|nr:E3 SUMO-protein ligase PIAS2 isoform X3 [Spodoptera frugiperda]
MVKTRSSARVGSAATSAPAENGTSSELRSRLKTTENGHRSQRPYNQIRNNQALPSGSVGPGSGSQGKDPLAPALPGRSLYQHATVSGYNTQDSRGQAMPVTARQNPIYPSSMYHGYGASAAGTLAPMPSPSPTAPLAPFPVHPDVKFRKLPFYDVLAELMKPSTMMPMQAGRMQEGTYVFHLTPQQATEIASGKDLVGTSNKLDYVIQAQLRFCLLETSCEQEDHFPPSVNVKVNNKMCPLPNPIPTNKPTPEPKRPPRPVNISSLVKLSPTVANTIQVTWAADFTRAYVLSVFMVRKLTSAELLQRLKNKGTKNPDYTRSLIKEKLSEDYDSEIATTSLRVSLMCPLGKMRMACPCRPANCPHLQCFDASLFLQMNERKPTWLCPVCDRPAPYDSLVVDGYFQEVLTSPRLSSECNEIQLHADGSWSAHAPPARAPQLQQPTAEPVTLISDDLEVIPVDSGVGAAKRAAVGEARAPRSADVMVDLTSDSDDELPLKRKIPPPKATPPASEVNIKTDDNYSSSAAEAVSSSGYRSPGVAGGACGVISLDSPSPPAPGSPPSSPRDSEPLPERPHLSITPVAPPTSNSSQHHIDLLTKRPQLSVSLVPPPEPASLHLVPHDVMTDGPHLSITPVTSAAPTHHIGSSTNAERDDAEATPAHWAPYADSERDDNYRKY